MTALLLHATYDKAAKRIAKVGFRVRPKTVKATAYCNKNEVSCYRQHSYTCSENILEEERRKLASQIPSRKNAVFFAPADGNSWLHEPEIFETKVDEEDDGYDDFGDYREPEKDYDFGFGKNHLFVVDSSYLPKGICGVGDTDKSDAVFGRCMDDVDPERNLGYIGQKKEDPRELARRFWSNAEIYDAQTYDPFVKDANTQEPKHEFPEIWCPTHVPKEAIVAHFHKGNPVDITHF